MSRLKKVGLWSGTQQNAEEYNKPAKGQGRIIVFSRIKEKIVQLNIIKHEKAKFTKHLRELYCLTEEDEYSLPRVDRLRGDTCPYVCPQTWLN